MTDHRPGSEPRGRKSGQVEHRRIGIARQFEAAILATTGHATSSTFHRLELVPTTDTRDRRDKQTAGSSVTCQLAVIRQVTDATRPHCRRVAPHMRSNAALMLPLPSSCKKDNTRCDYQPLPFVRKKKKKGEKDATAAMPTRQEVATAE